MDEQVTNIIHLDFTNLKMREDTEQMLKNIISAPAQGSRIRNSTQLCHQRRTKYHTWESNNAVSQRLFKLTLWVAEVLFLNPTSCNNRQDVLKVASDLPSVNCPETEVS